MKTLKRWMVAGLVLAGLGAPGCGSGVEEGIPEDIDLTKQYTPDVFMPTEMPSPKQAAEAMRKSREAAEKQLESAPAPPAEAPPAP